MASRFDIATMWVVMKQQLCPTLLDSTWLILGGRWYSACCTFHPPPIDRHKNYSQGEQSACKLISVSAHTQPHIYALNRYNSHGFSRTMSLNAHTHVHTHKHIEKKTVLRVGIGFAFFPYSLTFSWK